MNIPGTSAVECVLILSHRKKRHGLLKERSGTIFVVSEFDLNAHIFFIEEEVDSRFFFLEP
jgi:hypothetical protein